MSPSTCSSVSPRPIRSPTERLRPIRTVTRRDDVAHAGQTVERFDPGPQINPEPGDLDQSPRKEGGLGVIARAQSVADARGNPHDVFEGPGQLDPERIVTGVHTKRLVREEVANPAIEGIVSARDDHRGRQPAGQLLGVAGTGEDGDGRGPSTSRMIWLGRAKVPYSIPFTTLKTGTPGGRSAASRTSVARKYDVGTAATIRSAPGGRQAHEGRDPHRIGDPDSRADAAR